MKKPSTIPGLAKVLLCASVAAVVLVAVMWLDARWHASGAITLSACLVFCGYGCWHVWTAPH